jgi:hypothetical protein
MGVFRSTQTFLLAPADLGPVAQDVMQHFRGQEFEVTSEPTISGGWDISITHGGLFKSVLGLKTALKIEIEPVTNGTQVKAGIGVFGSQIIPALLAMYVAWPILIAQAWGLVQQAGLDEEALRCVENSLRAHAGASAPGSPHPSGGRFCTRCGAGVSGPVRFCIECGSPVEA